MVVPVTAAGVVPPTIPVKSPEKPVFAVMVVPVTAAGVVPPTIPSTLPSIFAFIVPTSPENTLFVSVASGIYVNFWSVSSIPKNPTFAETLLYLNLIPLSKLSSAVDSPISNTGSVIVTTVESIVVVVPFTVKSPVTVALPPTNISFLIPIPPSVIREPVAIDVDCVSFNNATAPVAVIEAAVAAPNSHVAVPLVFNMPALNVVLPVTSKSPLSLVEPVTSNFAVGAVVPFPIPKLPFFKNILTSSLIQKRISWPSLALRRVNPSWWCHKA